MPGKTRYTAQVESPTARAKLPPGKYPQPLIGKTALLYVKTNASRYGDWYVRTYTGKKSNPYKNEWIGRADDARAVADGLSVLCHADARAEAMKLLAAGGVSKSPARFTVLRCLGNYVDNI